ncbi:putative histone-fold protein [Helianthus annuus]|uniref:Histone-fold protein n=1 Tax=Helianthus annuus TaxID=4232 RepID=A0A9K3N8B7_HELAN|nr:putative histone-fold protein [Helianthus annuus]
MFHIGFREINRRWNDHRLRCCTRPANGDDLLCAMATLGFEDYSEPLKSYLTRYREMEICLRN